MDNVSVSLGLANAFDSTADLHNNDQDGSFAFLGGIEITAPDNLGPLSGSSVYIGYADGADSDDTLFYVGASAETPIEGLSLGIAYDDREAAHGDANALAIYAVYGLSETLTLGLRYDTLEDEGFQQTEINNKMVSAWDGDTRSQLAVTLGISLWENLLTRVELNAEEGNRDGGSSTGFAVNAFYAF